MSKLARRQHGVLITHDLEAGCISELSMTACPHCGGQFPTPRFGTSAEDRKSRIGRGYCYRCDGYICGAGCQECIPEEVRLQNIEAGRPELTPPKLLLAGGWDNEDTRGLLQAHNAPAGG